MVVTVRLAIVGASPSAVEMFVPDVPRRGRGQLLDDLATQLDGEARFVPVRTTSRVRLIAKHAIAWIAIDGSDDPDTLFDREHRVDVALVAGGTLTGTLLDSAPAARPRVVDHLNRGGAFVRLWTPGLHYFVNKAHILHVTEL